MFYLLWYENKNVYLKVFKWYVIVEFKLCKNLFPRYILVLFSTASSDLKLCDTESRLRVP